MRRSASAICPASPRRHRTSCAWAPTALSRTTSTATPTGGTRVLEGAALPPRPLPGPAGPAGRTLGGEATGWLGRDVTRVHPAATLADWWASLVIGRR